MMSRQGFFYTMAPGFSFTALVKLGGSVYWSGRQCGLSDTPYEH